ncbi:hypothetical protein L195_g036785, partial [Trifolium pratense]
MLPLKQKLSSPVHLHRRCGTQQGMSPDHLCQEDFRYKESAEPFIEQSTLIPLLSYERAAGGLSTFGLTIQ